MGEVLLLLFVVLLLFGATRLPQLAASVGKSIKSFKQGLRESESAPKSDPEKKD